MGNKQLLRFHWLHHLCYCVLIHAHSLTKAEPQQVSPCSFGLTRKFPFPSKRLIDPASSPVTTQGQSFRSATKLSIRRREDCMIFITGVTDGVLHCNATWRLTLFHVTRRLFHCSPQRNETARRHVIAHHTKETEHGRTKHFQNQQVTKQALAGSSCSLEEGNNANDCNKQTVTSLTGFFNKQKALFFLHLPYLCI